MLCLNLPTGLFVLQASFRRRRKENQWRDEHQRQNWNKWTDRFSKQSEHQEKGQREERKERERKREKIKQRSERRRQSCPGEVFGQFKRVQKTDGEKSLFIVFSASFLSLCLRVFLSFLSLLHNSNHTVCIKNSQLHNWSGPWYKQMGLFFYTS